MRFLLLFLLIPLAAFSQKDKLPGVYGNCNVSIERKYLCIQVEFFSNGTFHFHSYAHLAGWALTRGTWFMNTDTVILNAVRHDTISYHGQGTADSVALFIRDTTVALEFVLVTTKTGNVFKSYYTDGYGYCKIPRTESGNIIISVPGAAERRIVPDSAILSGSDSIYVRLDLSNHLHIENHRWLFDGNQLYYSQEIDGSFNQDIYLSREKKLNNK